MKQFQSRIIYNKPIGADFYELSLGWDVTAGIPAPGQFLTVRVSDGTVPLLRRPFAFSGYDRTADVASVIYQLRGRGTEILSEKLSRDYVDVVGPLGVPFPVGDDEAKAVVVAGGIGVGPMLFLSRALRRSKVQVSFVFGCRTAEFIPDCNDFENAAPRVCTDDGSEGFTGSTVQYIEHNIPLDGETVVYACGPEPMLKALYISARASGVKKIYLSLEAMMACGVGACMGCAVPVAGGGYRCVCKDGPVFDGEDILWDQL